MSMGSGWALLAAPLAWLMLAVLEKATPSGFLKAHMREQPPGTSPVRQIGGLALVPLYLCALAITAWLHPSDQTFVTALAASAALLWLVGIADDHRHQPIALRLAAQFIAAMAVVLTLPPSLTVLGGIFPLWVERLLLVLALVYAINVTNFMDGMDLMSVAGTGIPLCASALLLAGGTAVPAIAFPVLAMAAGLLGFAAFNRPPARLYLGDNGALPLGLTSGIASAALAFETNPVAAILPFGYYLADSASTLILRALHGENLFHSHSGHAYQVARRAGRSVQWVLVRVVIANLALALAAWFAARTANTAIFAASAAFGAGVSAGIVVHFRRQAKFA
ncbi:MAG: glycoside hydrolase [Nitratireductor sp.]|nr:glycoside hydrolase [Nitratireductor sp.]